MAKKLDTAKRKELAQKGHALPDGSFPIENVEDLKKAIQAFGLGKNGSAAKAHIIKRAKALGATDLLPSTWNIPPIKHGFTDVDDFLAHYGIVS
jgi:hypothetical protein